MNALLVPAVLLVCSAPPKAEWVIDVGSREQPWTNVPWVCFTPDSKDLYALDVTNREGQIHRWNLATRTAGPVVKVGGIIADFYAIPAPLAAMVDRNRIIVGGRDVRLDGAKPKAPLEGVAGKRPTSTNLRQEGSKFPDVPLGFWLQTNGDSYVVIDRDDQERGVLHRGRLSRAQGTASEDRTSLQTHEYPRLQGAAVSPDGKHLAVSNEAVQEVFSPENVLRLLEVGDPMKVLATVKQPHEGSIHNLLFRPDGKLLATGSEDGAIKLWDLPEVGNEWKPRATITGPTFGAHGMSFSPDGKLLAVGTWDRADNLWIIDVEAGKLLKSTRTERGIMSLAFSPDGKWLASGSIGVVQLWAVDNLLRPE